MEHEGIARISYKSSVQSHHKNFKISPSGLVINPLYPHLGASPDGIICCDCCGKSVLEIKIKCPYNAREGSPHESVNSIDCLYILNGELHLNTSHAYYYQVQAQMIICQANFADFVVWTKNGIFIECI